MNNAVLLNLYFTRSQTKQKFLGYSKIHISPRTTQSLLYATALKTIYVYVYSCLMLRLKQRPEKTTLGTARVPLKVTKEEGKTVALFSIIKMLFS